jgi:hypothetical protein
MASYYTSTTYRATIAPTHAAVALTQKLHACIRILLDSGTPEEKDKERHMRKLKGASSSMKIGNKNSNFSVRNSDGQRDKFGIYASGSEAHGNTTTAHAVYRSKSWINRRDDFFSGKKRGRWTISSCYLKLKK